MAMRAAFYCVADERYFLGAVGLVNSLRLVGHDEPIVLLDCGLTGAQRDLLGSEAEVIEAPEGTPPTLLKTVAPLARPADVMVLLDTDLVVTRSLEELLDSAARGNVVAFDKGVDRWVADWGRVLGLGDVPRRTYLDFAMLGIGAGIGLPLLEQLGERQGRIDFDRTMWGSHDEEYELLYADQDVLNAILAARVPSERVVALDPRLAPVPPFAGLRVADEASLRCAYDDGTEPYVVHHFIVKPWLEPTHHGVYSQLLRRLLASGDVAIRVPDEEIPLRLRRGPLAYAERKRVNARERIRFRLQGGA
jgi:hypothetical protein